MSEPQQPYGPPPGYGTSGYGQQPPADPVPGWPPAAGQPAAGSLSGWGSPPHGQPSPHGPGAPWPGPAETSSRAVVALVLAVGSFVVLPFLSAVAALFVASSATREIDASGGRLSGRGLATAAKVVSWINIVLCVLAVVAVVALVGVFAVAGTTAP